jgi:flagellar basal body-associated protein FliL
LKDEEQQVLENNKKYGKTMLFIILIIIFLSAILLGICCFMGCFASKDVNTDNDYQDVKFMNS